MTVVMWLASVPFLLGVLGAVHWSELTARQSVLDEAPSGWSPSPVQFTSLTALGAVLLFSQLLESWIPAIAIAVVFALVILICAFYVYLPLYRWRLRGQPKAHDVIDSHRPI